MKTHLRNAFLIALPLAVFLAAWQYAVEGNQRLQFLFASPLMVWQAALDERGHATIWHDAFLTFGEAALGLVSGTLLGTIAGLLLWGNGRIDVITRPYIVFLGSIPIFALAPITIIWFGVGLLSKVVMAGFAVFFVSLMQTYEGAHAVARQHLGFAHSIGASNGKIIRKIIIPGAIDWLIAGYKMNVGAALIGAFIGEFVSSEAGLGHYILKASALYDVPRVLLGIFFISILGLIMTSFAGIVQRMRKV